MGKMISSVALAVRPCFISGIPQRNYIISPIILDTHFAYHILCESIFPFGRAFMTDQTKAKINARRVLLKKYSYDLLFSLGIFVVFAVVFVVCEIVAGVAGQFGILIRIVGWSI
jgi:hypothetical protein